MVHYLFSIPTGSLKIVAWCPTDMNIMSLEVTQYVLEMGCTFIVAVILGIKIFLEIRTQKKKTS